MGVKVNGVRYDGLAGTIIGFFVVIFIGVVFLATALALLSPFILIGLLIAWLT